MPRGKARPHRAPSPAWGAGGEISGPPPAERAPAPARAEAIVEEPPAVAKSRLLPGLAALLLLLALLCAPLQFESVALTDSFLHKVEAFGQPDLPCYHQPLFQFSGASLATTGDASATGACPTQVSGSAGSVGNQWLVDAGLLFALLGFVTALTNASRRRSTGVLVPLLAGGAACCQILGALTFVSHLEDAVGKGPLSDAISASPGPGLIASVALSGAVALGALGYGAMRLSRQALAPLPG